MKSKRAQKRCTDCPEHCFCGSSKQLEDNHLGGRKHVPWLWLPNCGIDHALFHIMCRRAGVDFRKQSSKLMAQVQAFKAQLIGLWMAVESMEKQIKHQSEGTNK